MVCSVMCDSGRASCGSSSVSAFVSCGAVVLFWSRSFFPLSGTLSVPVCTVTHRRPRKRPCVMESFQQEFGEHSSRDSKRDHAKSDEQLHGSVGLVSEVVRHCDHDCHVCAPTPAPGGGGGVNGLVLRQGCFFSPQGWCFDFKRSCHKPKGPGVLQERTSKPNLDV